MTGTMPTSLEDLLSGTRVEGVDKTASAQSLPVGQEETTYATELAMLEKFAQEQFSQEDMLKIAASSKGCRRRSFSRYHRISSSSSSFTNTAGLGVQLLPTIATSILLRDPD